MREEYIYTAKSSNKRFSHYCVNELPDGDDYEQIIVDPESEGQVIIGFGGAFTDTASGALSQMNSDLQKIAMMSYFDSNVGLGYNAGRIPIGACDFSRELYSMDEEEGDESLSHFSTESDKKGIIPLIKWAKTYLNDKDGLYLYALPWSPPAWMKTNGDMLHGGSLKEQHYEAMADYICKFVDEYKKEGIDIRGITSQNVPDEIQNWPSCIYSETEEKKMLHLLADRITDDNIKLLCWDSNRNRMQSRVKALLADEYLRKEIDGVAFHGYSEGYYEELDKVHSIDPDLKLCATEFCSVKPDGDDDWYIGEKYAHDIISDLNHWTSLWLDWNLFLDENSGPKFVDNPCTSPIVLNQNEQTIIYRSSYYYIGHFSRYIKRGAVKISTKTLDGSKLECCAVRNPDGSYAIIIMNRTEQAKEVEVIVRSHKSGIVLEPHSICTLLLKSERQ